MLLPWNINGSSGFYKGPRTCKVSKSADPSGPWIFAKTTTPFYLYFSIVSHCACSGKWVLFTHPHTGSSIKMAIVPTPNNYWTKRPKKQKKVESSTVHALEKWFCLPIGTLAPVAKWQSCLLRVRTIRCPNMLGLSAAWEDRWPPPGWNPDPAGGTLAPPGEPLTPLSPMSISRINHLSGLVSTIGEDGVDWIAQKRSFRLPNP